MDMNFEQKVRERAYEIWISMGMGHGMAHEHWMIAEKAIANETGAPVQVKATRTRKAPVAKAEAPTKAAAPKKTAAKKAPAKAVVAKATLAKASAAKVATHYTH